MVVETITDIGSKVYFVGGKMDKKIALKIMKELMSIERALEQLTEISDYDAEEGRALRKFLGRFIAPHHDLLRYVVRQHPDLDPDK